jgi:RNA polymerase sigma-70 factor (ECF subfamily)
MAPPKSDTSTESLLARHRAGDRDAADRIFHKLLPNLYRFARGRLPDWARRGLDTQDLVQEALIRVYPRLSSIEVSRPGDLGAYVRRAIENQVRDQIRSVGARGRSIPVEEAQETLASREPGPADYAELNEDYHRYLGALSRLAESDREVIIARVQLGLGHAEVAERVGLRSPDAARMSFQRAMVRLERALR